MKEFNLSDKIAGIKSPESESNLHYIKKEDVKEFIKKLKETIEEGVNRNNILPLDWCFDRIDKLAGEHLR